MFGEKRGLQVCKTNNKTVEDEVCFENFKFNLISIWNGISNTIIVNFSKLSLKIDHSSIELVKEGAKAIKACFN